MGVITLLRGCKQNTLLTSAPEQHLSPSEETELISLCGRSDPESTGKSSSRESTSPRPEAEDRERCGISGLEEEPGLSRREGETQGGEGEGDGGGEGGGEGTEGLKRA